MLTRRWAGVFEWLLAALKGSPSQLHFNSTRCRYRQLLNAGPGCAALLGLGGLGPPGSRAGGLCGRANDVGHPWPGRQRRKPSPRHLWCRAALPRLPAQRGADGRPLRPPGRRCASEDHVRHLASALGSCRLPPLPPPPPTAAHAAVASLQTPRACYRGAAPRLCSGTTSAASCCLGALEHARRCRRAGWRPAELACPYPCPCRERIRLLLDPGSPFLELSQLAGKGLYGGRHHALLAAVVAGPFSSVAVAVSTALMP